MPSGRRRVRTAVSLSLNNVISVSTLRLIRDVVGETLGAYDVKSIVRDGTLSGAKVVSFLVDIKIKTKEKEKKRKLRTGFPSRNVDHVSLIQIRNFSLVFCQ